MSEPKKKLCWNCEGSVSKHIETCPYCGVYLSPMQQDEQESLLPPYPSESLKTQAIPKPPYQSEPAQNESSEVGETVEETVIFPLLLLLTGTTFALFGITLWLFSEKGRLTLSWNSDWGPLFLLLALPLLGFGIRKLLRLESD